MTSTDPNTQKVDIFYVDPPFALSQGEAKWDSFVMDCRNLKLEDCSQAMHRDHLQIFVVSAQNFHALEKILDRQKLKDKEYALGACLVWGTTQTLRQKKRILHSSWVLNHLPSDPNRSDFFFHLRQMVEKLVLKEKYLTGQKISHTRQWEAKVLNDVSLALSVNTSIDDLCDLIVQKAVDLTSSDCAFLFLQENFMKEIKKENVRILRDTGLRFALKARLCKSQTVHASSSLLNPLHSPFTSLLINCGSGLSWCEPWEQLHILRDDGDNGDIKIFPDLEHGEEYTLKSFCAFPLKSTSGDTMGFMLLVNRRHNRDVRLRNLKDVASHVHAFTDHDMNMVESLCNQTAMSMDHIRLIDELQRIFESFVQASVVAIESRDPTTKGHSERVGILTVGLAEAVSQIQVGPYANVAFSRNQINELRYAALLHDFGKIGVREDVLRKEKKLFTHEMNVIRERLLSIEKQLHLKCLEKYIEKMIAGGHVPQQKDMDAIREEVKGISQQFDSFWKNVCQANEPHVMQASALQAVINLTSTEILLDNKPAELLSPEEIEKLSIRRGSLSYEERREIEKHVIHSHRFLTQIPWTQQYANIPDIVYAHHEKLDGSGYPRQLTDGEIPVQSKIMTISDIYDALVAMDRPYKKAISHLEAMNILEWEVKEGKLDKHLFEIFARARVFDLIDIGEEEKKAA